MMTETSKIFGIEPGIQSWLDREAEAQDNWLVDDLIYRNTICMLDGMGSSGKSYIALQLALAVASGLPFLGLLPVQQPGRVLVLNGEDPEPVTHGRFRNIAHNYLAALGEDGLYRAAKNITYISMSNVDMNSILLDEKMQPTAAYTEISQFCRLWKPDLVILDPLIMFIADENKSAYAMQFYLALRKLDATVLVLHHNNKSAMVNDPSIEDRAKARGSSVWVENAKTRMHLKSDTIFVEKNNFSARGRCHIKLRFENGMWFGAGIEYDRDGDAYISSGWEGETEEEVNLIPKRGRKRRTVGYEL